MKTIIVAVSVAVVLGIGVYLYAAPQPQQVHQATPEAVSPTPASAQSPVRPASRPSPSTVTPNVGTPSTTPSIIVVNTPATVTVTALITPAPIANGVNLLSVGATGTQPTIIGVMHDDGKNGDAVAGDGVYSIQVPLIESTAGQIQLQVSAAFQGLLKRATSLILLVPVWGATGTSTSSFIYPPSLQIVSSSPTSVLLQTTPLQLAPSGAETDPSGRYADSGYGVGVEDISFPGSNFDLNAFLSANFPGSIPDVSQFTTSVGTPAYMLDFSGESGDYPTTIVVPSLRVAHVFTFLVQKLTQQQYLTAEDDFTNTALTVRAR